MTMELARHLPKGYERSFDDLAGWEIDVLERVAESRFGVPSVPGKRRPDGAHWAVAQTVTKMEHLARREIEKTNHGAFLPTYAHHRKVDGRQYSNERPLLSGYVLFRTAPDDWAGIPDIHGIYGVLAGPDERGRLKPSPVTDAEMIRLFMGSALNHHNQVDAPRYTKYFRGEKPKRKTSRKPRPGNRLRNYTAA